MTILGKEGAAFKKTAAPFLLGFFLIIILGLAIVLYTGTVGAKNLSQGKLSVFAANVLRLKIAKVNGHSVLYKNYVNDLITLTKLYGQQSPDQKISDDLISEQVLSRLIANVVIEDLADKFNVKVAKEDIEKITQNIYQQYGDENKAAAELEKNYGWNMNIYIDRVIKPLLLQEKVMEAFQNSDTQGYDGADEIRASHILFTIDEEHSDADMKKLGEEVLAKIKGGEDFAKMAEQYGTDSTASLGGDLNWFGKGSMVPEFEEAVFTLNQDQLSDSLVKTKYGYHIVKNTGKRKAKNFDKYITDQLKQAKIEILMDVKNPFDKIEEPTQ
jgi:parvulin-like peptidyl-prolyl isomerase